MALNPNSRYPTQTNAPTAQYPYGSARNITVPNDGTGTPWEEDIVNDLFGFQQELLDKAGITPSGNADEVDDSEYYNAMRLTSGHPGLVVPIALNVTPASLGLRLLLLDGSGVLRATYADLDTYTYVGDSQNPTADAFYRADDAAGTSRNISGAYLILPDMRGYFLRGLDIAGAVDPDGSGRIIGNIQNDAVLRHNHVVMDETGVEYQRHAPFTISAGGVQMAQATALKSTATVEASAVDIGKDISGFTNITGIGEVSSENRPTNICFNFGVWY